MFNTFKRFLNDKAAAEMFISGQAGTGKTTGLFELVTYCISNNIKYVVVAHTHDACDILRLKLPKDTNVQTTHKFLKKRPTVNEHATKVKHINSNKQQGNPDDYAIMFLDEYSQLGEKDYSDIGDKQYVSGTDIPDMKAIYIGDTNQLLPVDDIQAVHPSGKYNVKLTKIWRQADDNQLIDTLTKLVSYIEGAKPEPLEEHKTFVRGSNIIFGYQHTKESKLLLAYTNERVQELNAIIKGREKPIVNDEVFSPNTRFTYSYLNTIKVKDISYIELPFGDEPLAMNTKYKTLEHLVTMSNVTFATLADEEGDEQPYAVVFGHYDYKIILEELGKIAVTINKKIEKQYNTPAKQWAFANRKKVLAKKRAKAWRDYFTFKNCVMCIDFPYAMTVHKSQGGTHHTIFLDTKNLGICAQRDYNTYLRLMYVGISRASNIVYTN